MDTTPAHPTEPAAPMRRTPTDAHPARQEPPLTVNDRNPLAAAPLVVAGVGILSTVGLAVVGSVASDRAVRIALLVGVVVALASMAATCVVHRMRVDSLGAELAEARSRAGEGRDREATLAESRRQLVAWVSDDLHTPLARLQATAEALEDGVIVEPLEVAAALAVMGREIDDVAGLVHDLHELSQVHDRDGRPADPEHPRLRARSSWSASAATSEADLGPRPGDGHARAIFDAVFQAAPADLQVAGAAPGVGDPRSRAVR